ncbi:DUF7009 family protein [Roseivirga sp.]|uniref:DUF7009 family protein n=1 Tax=Roseivirga sp. TaxID=1964215 RepID=UPI002B2679EE|nr:hypothetical protein [Roseivirga sp.]
MKLRIQGNSIRVRLTQTEVNQLGEGIDCISHLDFPNSSSLNYRLSVATVLGCKFSDNLITISLPETEVRGWATSDHVGIEGDLTLENGDKLSILVEKDFKCLTERAEDESDLFPNPKESH